MTDDIRVYVATAGAYDDYRILGVFSTWEAAAACGRKSGDIFGWQVEVYVLDKPGEVFEREEFEVAVKEAPDDG